jgi:hypothetical protein
MVQGRPKPFIRNIAEVPWREFPNHLGGALSKPLVMPETTGSRHIDYRISMYQPMARLASHSTGCRSRSITCWRARASWRLTARRTWCASTM